MILKTNLLPKQPKCISTMELISGYKFHWTKKTLESLNDLILDIDFIELKTL